MTLTTIPGGLHVALLNAESGPMLHAAQSEILYKNNFKIFVIHR